MKISTCIITFNEEKNIAECIESVKNFSDEIIVVDSGSTDKTVEISRNLGAKVIFNKWEGFAKQKQFAVNIARYLWIFSIDADERATKELSNKILLIKNSDKLQEYKAFYVNRRNIYLGKWIKYGGWYPEKRIRFFHRDFAAWQGDRLHEKVIVKKRVKIYDLNLDIIHYPYKNISHHLEKINSYTNELAIRNIKNNKKVSFAEVIYKPIFKFIRDYFIKRGFLLGKVGFIHAAMGSIYSFMKYLKTFENQKLKK